MSQLGPWGETQEAFNSPGLTLAALLGLWIRVLSVCPSARHAAAGHPFRAQGFSDTGKGGSLGDDEDGGNRAPLLLHQDTRMVHGG